MAHTMHLICKGFAVLIAILSLRSCTSEKLPKLQKMLGLTNLIIELLQYVVAVQLEEGFESKMALSHNRQAFRAPLRAPGEPCPPLLGAYLSLVAIEIFLKDHLLIHVARVPATHDVPKMLKTLSTYVGVKHSGLFTSVATQLSTKLANLYCQGKDGNPSPVPSGSYPYLRYVRHSDDWDSSASTNEQLTEVLVISNQIIHAIFKATGEKV